MAGALKTYAFACRYRWMAQMASTHTLLGPRGEGIGPKSSRVFPKSKNIGQNAILSNDVIRILGGIDGASTLRLIHLHEAHKYCVLVFEDKFCSRLIFKSGPQIHQERVMGKVVDCTCTTTTPPQSSIHVVKFANLRELTYHPLGDPLHAREI